MEIFQGVSENKFVMVLLNEQQYNQKLGDLIKNIEKNHAKICYVSLSKPYATIIEYLKENNLDVDKFFFIDVLSSHYQKQKPAENCIFIEGPDKLISIQTAISKAIATKNCSAIIFDTVSSLLMYEQIHDIIRFTHQLTIEKKQQDVNKIYIVLKENANLASYYETLIKDIDMFTDKTIDLKNNSK